MKLATHIAATTARMDPVANDNQDPAERSAAVHYRHDEIALAFDRIRDHHDWKAPIHAVIHASERELVAAAVAWFTGTVAEFQELEADSDRLIVDAPGQRLGPRGAVGELPRRFGAHVRLAGRDTRNPERDVVPDRGT